jgi:arginyl-tRNA synthetase
LNFRFDAGYWQQVVPAILAQKAHFGDSSLGKGTKINVEYVSANPTGPLHVGHARGAVFGDALSLLLHKAGYDVTKEYYINDAGSQVDTLARSLHLRYREALGETIGEIPAGMYPGDYLIPPAQALAKEMGDKYAKLPESEWLVPLRRYAVTKMMDMIRDDLALLNIRHDVFTSEFEITQAGKVDAALALLEKKGLIYHGVLEAPKGKTPDDWEPRPQTLFRSTDFGDDVDRALKKSDGSWTYFAPDIALHLDKIERGHTVLVNVWGADHGGYVKRMQAAVKALSDGQVPVTVKLCQLVKFLRGGEPAKMSKRAGTFVTAREVVEEVGSGVFRFIMLTRKNDAPLDFDFEKVMEQSKDNPVFYVQYAHARCKSVLRNAKEQGKTGQGGDVSLLSHAAEIELIKKLAYFPVVVEQAAQAYEPHRIAFYLHELAAEFHAFWNQGNTNESLRFIVSDEKLTAARLVLVDAVAMTIATGLSVLGVEPVEEMR